MGIRKANITSITSETVTKRFVCHAPPSHPQSTNSFYKEVDVLQQLEKNFINIPKIDHHPFPKIISYNDIPNEKNCISFTMTNCGISSWDYHRLEKKHRNIKPTNYYNTVECIINNLKNNRIVYEDFKADNVCITTEGHVSLIDFGRFKQINTTNHHDQRLEKYYKKPNLNEFKKSLYSYVGCCESDALIEKAIVIDPTTDRLKWKNPIFKQSPWSILYCF